MHGLGAMVERVHAWTRAAYADEAGEMTAVRLWGETAGVLPRLARGGAGARVAR